MESFEEPPLRVASLSLSARVAVCLGVGVVMIGALFHLGMVFLHVAPSNTLSREHAVGLGRYVYPEFEQNWKLFAPDPLQSNIHVQARAEVRGPGGGMETTGWVDLTGMDVAAMRHDPVPSHTRQNELRRAWGFYTDTHDAGGQPTAGDRSDLSRSYLLRIVERRFGRRLGGGRVVRVQARAVTTPVPRPPWATDAADTTAQTRLLPWWIADTRPSGRENAS